MKSIIGDCIPIALVGAGAAIFAHKAGFAPFGQGWCIILALLMLGTLVGIETGKQSTKGG